MDHILVEGVCVSPDHYIGGERITSSATFEDISPIDETLMGSVAAGGPAEVEAAVVAAQKAFPAWAALGPQGRGQHLRRLADVIESHTEELAIVETRDNGSLFKTNRESMVNRSARNFRYFAEVAERLHGDMWNSDADHTRTQNRVLYHSAGVTAIVTPWNGPLSGLRLPVLCWPIMRKRLAFHQESSILSRAWARMLGPRWWLTQASDASRLPVHLRLREALAKRQQKILLLWASNWVANRHL